MSWASGSFIHTFSESRMKSVRSNFSIDFMGDEMLIDYGDEYVIDEDTCISTNRKLISIYYLSKH